MRFKNLYNHLYHYAKWEGSRWKDNFVVNSKHSFPSPRSEFPGLKESTDFLSDVDQIEPYLSGGLSLDKSNPSRMVVSTKVESGTFEISVLDSPDQGTTWNQLNITSHSSFVNVRPVIISSNQSGFTVFWIQVKKYANHLNFNSVVMYSTVETV